ncbi:MAG: hypothetical protein IKK85_06110 [Clostridia bacterium]|nr:hypothetical protein [Clostridia bacterium]
MKHIIVTLLGILALFLLFCGCNSETNYETTTSSTITTEHTTERKESTTKKYTTYTTKDKYSSLTNSDKKAICEYIESRYDYYDSIYGGYSGDTYSDTIMKEAANRYGLTVNQIEIIWMNMYSY